MADDNTPVIMDLGSAEKAVVKITNRNQALALQVRENEIETNRKK